MKMKYLDYVNIRQGTRSTRRYSNGNTLPLTQLPFGMNGFCPQTKSDDGNWFYHPEDRSLEGTPYSDENRRWSGFRPEEAIIRPDYMKINLLRYKSTIELSPTERGACIRVKYNGNLIPRFAVMPVNGEYGFEVDVLNSRVYGYTTSIVKNIAVNFKMYFVLEFNCKIDISNTVFTCESGEMQNAAFDNFINSGHGSGINLALTDRNVEIKIATSYISRKQAVINLENELVDYDFNQIKSMASKKWEEMLSKVKVECYSDDQMRTFYSCLARVFLYPAKSYEIDEEGRPVHYCPHNGEIAEGVSYTNNGFWDTFRTVYPLLSIISPEKYAEILEGFINIYKDCGWLPKWPVMGEFGLMPGTYIDAVIADAAVKDIITEDLLEIALEGMIKHANVKPEDERYGRRGVLEYNRYGYVPNDFHESVNHSLDSCYGDFCIAQVAKKLGKMDIYEEYTARSDNYKLLFDKSSGFMRGKNRSGEMKEIFSPFNWGGEYTEASAFQTSFAVHHDFDGLALLHGGINEIIKKIDEVFQTPPLYSVGDYGFEIHEMTEMAAVDFGQCAISNQPSFHIPYLYSYFGEIEKTAYWVEKICKELFSSEDDGYPGDEDNGTMAAWYVLSSLGFYQICPGKAEYVKGKMLVRNAKIDDVELIRGDTLEIIRHEEIVKSKVVLGKCN